jgi:hypothetical protein
MCFVQFLHSHCKNHMQDFSCLIIKFIALTVNTLKRAWLCWRLAVLICKDIEGKEVDEKIFHWGRPAGDWTLKRSRKVRSKGRALLFLVSKQNLNPSSWHIWHTKNHWKWIRNEKVMAPKVKGVKNSKKQNHWTIQRLTLEHSKEFFVCCFVAIRVQKWFVELKMTLL